MIASSTYTCSRCTQPHDGPPVSYAAPAPAYWNAECADQLDSVLADEQCVPARVQWIAEQISHPNPPAEMPDGQHR
ncbi:hypothetical protein AB0H76_33190 [Nocardia sp. NPDC050712]|uniref:hypothetical protein n=1 Tax=Nocardia sp. NPDC050712 TaxID=3155518 RepID=UPI0033C1BF21